MAGGPHRNKPRWLPGAADSMLAVFLSRTRWLRGWLVLPLVFGLAPLQIVSAAGSGQVRIISTNDIHGYMRSVYYRYMDQLRPWGMQTSEGDYLEKAGFEGKVGGLAHVATVIDRLRSEVSGNALVVDSGDTWHGSGVSLFDQGESMVKVMNAIGYDAMVPGNWEYFFNRERFMELVEQSDFPVIAYNLTDKEWDEPVLEQYVIKQVGDLKVAVIGMTYPWTGLASVATTGAAKWWNFGIREAEAEELIEQIKSSDAPDLIVFISHAGYAMDRKFAQRVDGIDVIISGHTHAAIFDPVVYNKTFVYEGGAHGEYVASLDLEVKDGEIAGYDYRLVKVQQNNIPADPEVDALVEAAYRTHADKLYEVVGEAEGLFYRQDYWQSTLGNLITDSLRQIEGVDITFFPAWRYGVSLMPGEITAEDVYNIVPTDGRIFTYSMPGREIRTLIENLVDAIVNPDPFARVGGDMIRFSGLEIVADPANDRGQRILSITTADGEPLSPDKYYSVASVHTRFQDNPMFGATDVVDTGKVFVEELIRHIRAHSPVTPGLDDRMVAHGATRTLY